MKAKLRSAPERRAGFTLTELMVVIAVVALLAVMLLPALAGTRIKSQDSVCLNNTRQLTLAWLMYAQENNDKVANNMGVVALTHAYSAGQFNNWCLNVQDWSTSPQNIDVSQLKRAQLATYLHGNTKVFRCPDDIYLSPPQKAAGYTNRLRSYAMNGNIGDHDPNHTGFGGNDTGPYGTKLKLTQVKHPANFFVFIDEQADACNDGFFAITADPASTQGGKWADVPASYHDGACSLSFADGHSETHEWLSSTTKLPVTYGPVSFAPWDAAGVQDFRWLQSKTSDIQ